MNKARHPFSSFTADEVEFNLIFLVQENPQLYDTSHDCFYNFQEKSEAWDKIALALGKSREWCILQWRTLLSDYATRRRLIKMSDEWPHGRALQFMDKHLGFPSLPKLMDIDFGSFEEETKSAGTNSNSEHFPQHGPPGRRKARRSQLTPNGTKPI